MYIERMAEYAVGKLVDDIPALVGYPNHLAIWSVGG